MSKAEIGTIIHGTGRTQDLLHAFSEELERLGDDSIGDMMDNLLCEITEILQGYAPPYCCFGPHEGDTSDYGFWPDMEQIDDLPHVNNADEARTLGEDCKYVNDHGNVTVYGGDGSVLLEIV